jgi:hypothetical protein
MLFAALWNISVTNFCCRAVFSFRRSSEQIAPLEEIMTVHAGPTSEACPKECLCRRDAAFQAQQVHCVEVEDEPSHPELFCTPWVRVYAGILAQGNCTLYHRHRRDTLYLTLRDASLWNEYFVDPTLKDARTESYQHDAKIYEVFGRWHARDGMPLVHRVCYRLDEATAPHRSASPTSLFVGIEFIEYPTAAPEQNFQRTTPIEAVAERMAGPVCDRMRLWRLRADVAALQLAFSGIRVDWSTPLDATWQTTDVERLTMLTGERVRFFHAGERMDSLIAGTLVVELLPRPEYSGSMPPEQS